MLSQIDAVAAVNGSEEMPASYVVRAITTRRSKRLAKHGKEAKCSREEAKSAEEGLNEAQNASGTGLNPTESSTQPTLPLPVSHEKPTDKTNSSVAMEGVEAVGCEGAVPHAQEAISSAEPASDNQNNESAPLPAGFWVEAAEDGVHLTAELTTEAVIAAQIKDFELRAMRQFVQNDVLPEDPTLRAWVLVRGDEFLLQAGLLIKAQQVRVLGQNTVHACGAKGSALARGGRLS